MKRFAILTFIFAVALSSTQSAQITSPEAVTAPPPSLVSDTASTGASSPVVSADGNFVAFVSRAPNLVTNPTSGSYQIFSRHLPTDNLTLVSVTPEGRGGNGHSMVPTVAANGNVIAFESEAADLVPEDTNGVSDIFVRELGHRQTWRLTSGNGPSRNPLISANGYVAYESRASDLVANDTNNAQDVFLQDVIEAPLLITVNMSGTGPANRGSELLTVTPNGRFVAFWSEATDLAPGIANTQGEIYVRDIQNATTYCITKSIQTYYGPRRYHFALTPDGDLAAVQELNYPISGPGGRVFLVNTFTGFITNVYCCGRPTSGLLISQDGSQLIFGGQDGLYLYNKTQGSRRLLLFDPGPFDFHLTITQVVVSEDFQRLWFTKLTNSVYPYDLRYAIGSVNQLYVYDIAEGSQRLLSTNAFGQPIKAGVSLPFSVDAAGAIVAYETSSTDLAGNDFNVATDVFLGDRRLISARHTNLPPGTATGHSTLPGTALNANGTRIAFLSSDSSLTLNDTNRYNDLFVRDFSENTLFPVDGLSRSNSIIEPAFSAEGASVAFERFSGEERPTSFVERGFLSRADLRTGQIQILGSPNFAGGNPHWSPSLSQDGRWLVVRDGNRIRITDFQTPPVPGQSMFTTVDVKATGPGDANAPSSNPKLSLDGGWVIFVSRASDLIRPPDGASAGPPYAAPQVFAAKFWQQPTRLVSIAPDGSALPAGGTNPVISANARFVAFETYTGSNIYRHDLLARGPVTNILVCSSCSRPAINGDGRFVLYQSGGQLYVRDVQNDGTQNIGAAGANDAILSIDGRFVAFVQSGQVYLHDRWTQDTHLLSRNTNGDGGNAPSSRPVFSHDGRTVAFQSFASDLVLGDYNRRRDIFIVRIQPIDTDSDGMDDDWEDYHFGSLAQDGSADVDADQHTDHQEFLAGTDPRDPSSVLRLRTSARRSAPWVLNPELKWSSAPGRTYRLQHTPDLSLPWTDLEDFLTGGFNAATPSPGAGLYRMKLID